MLDTFFTQKLCDRCKGDLRNGRIMSMINKDCICFECSIKETQSERYEEAVAAEQGEICSGNWNYDGIGFEEESRK